MNLGVNSMIFTTSTASSKSGDDQFPVGLRVLAVDDDPICLTILEKMLRSCLYEVTKCSRAESALELLRDNKNGFDIVISDVHMPDMDGFKLIEHLGRTGDGFTRHNVVMKGVVHGACDYMIKPVRIEALKNIWQHVVRKRRHEWMDKDFENSGSLEDGLWPQQPSDQDANPSSSANEGNSRSSRKRKDDEDEVDIEIDDREDASTTKKPPTGRVVV